MVNERSYWLDVMLKIAMPVLQNLADDTLKKHLPDINPACHRNAPLEAFGRTVYGIAPWLELKGLTGQEKEAQALCRELFQKALKNATDPGAADHMIFGGGEEKQPLVDTAFLCNALVRAPENLTGAIKEQTKEQLVSCLNLARKIEPLNNNWILFSAMVETGLYSLGAEYDKERIRKHVRQMLEWYKGDGLYGDGEAFRFDYYNSFVIQPMLIDIVNSFDDVEAENKPLILKRAQRYAAILERMVSPEGAFPIVGRSVCYRFGAFQSLSQMALLHQLPDAVSPAQARCAMTAVIKRLMEADSVFDRNGWLSAGLYGRQPGLAERYINAGSLYLCCAVFPVLGLPPSDEFWQGEDQPWTSRKIYAGEDLPADKAIKI